MGIKLIDNCNKIFYTKKILRILNASFMKIKIFK